MYTPEQISLIELLDKKTPCSPEKIRNPETKRCVNKKSKKGKEILTRLQVVPSYTKKQLSDTLALDIKKPCSLDKIRNPETKRCVNKKSKKGREVLRKMGTTTPKVSSTTTPKVSSTTTPKVSSTTTILHPDGKDYCYPNLKSGVDAMLTGVPFVFVPYTRKQISSINKFPIPAENASKEQQRQSREQMFQGEGSVGGHIFASLQGKQNPMGMNSGMVNRYGTDVHIILGEEFSTELEEIFPGPRYKLGNNRMSYRKKFTGAASSLSDLSYHWEGQQTGIPLEDMTDYIGFICPCGQPRGFAGISFINQKSPNDARVPYAEIVKASKIDRLQNKNKVNRNNKFFLKLKPDFWRTEVGKLMSPVETLCPKNHYILFNTALPHGVSRGVTGDEEGYGLYLDIFREEEAAKKPHNDFWKLQTRLGNLLTTPRTAGHRYPHKGYYEGETYDMEWIDHKIYTFLLRSMPSHWPSGKETFIVHSAAMRGIAERVKDRDMYTGTTKSGQVHGVFQFRYPKNTEIERPILLNLTIQKMCNRKGFDIPRSLMGKRVKRDPSLLSYNFAVRFGFPDLRDLGIIDGVSMRPVGTVADDMHPSV